MSLTRKQAELLTFIDGYIKSEGCAPSYEEMRASAGIASKSGIHRLLEAIEERGYIRRIEHRARAIEVIRRVGEPAQPHREDELTKFRAALIKIAAGDGTYGAQAHEYKQIARKALGMPT